MRRTSDILALIIGMRIPDAYIEKMIEEMDDDSEDLEAVMDALDKYRPELRMRLKEKAARNI